MYFTWFVYTFVNQKYNVLLKRDDVCLMPLSNLITLSRFDERKEIRIVRWPRSPMLNVVATQQQRYGNVLITSENEVVTTLETDVGTALIFDRAKTLRQRQQQHCDNVVTTSLCQLWYSQYHHQVLYFLYLTRSHQHNNVTTAFARLLNWRYCTDFEQVIQKVYDLMAKLG